MITYTVICDVCMYEHANQSDRCPDVTTDECGGCGQEYCDMCPEKLEQCQNCGIMYCSCTPVVGGICEHCEHDEEEDDQS